MKIMIEVDLDDVEYPDLFRIPVLGTEYAFQDIERLPASGFKPLSGPVDSDIVTLFQANEIGLSSDFFENVYVKNFFTHKIMAIVTKSESIPEQPDMHCYYVKATILLDHNGKLITTLGERVPSIVFYRREGRVGKFLNNIVSDGFAILHENYYYFTEVIDYDEYISEYNTTFRDYNHNLLATNVHENMDINSVALRNSTFYSNGNRYEPSVLSEFCATIDSKKFIDWFNVRLSLNKEQVKLLDMFAI